MLKICTCFFFFSFHAIGPLRQLCCSVKATCSSSSSKCFACVLACGNWHCTLHRATVCQKHIWHSHIMQIMIMCFQYLFEYSFGCNAETERLLWSLKELFAFYLRSNKYSFTEVLNLMFHIKQTLLSLTTVSREVVCITSCSTVSLL